ncbi:CLUMA_CG001319, isoform A [Clunio marinus]|uniref:CLUMA_CG001319, isoform A n=1 Tax=Clunio marinus TaxID=568069 RepID=A0A1J1HM43_9DIPT|nr:CLUMA_CG001319, isoform A [Clunio marinus]
MEIILNSKNIDEVDSKVSVNKSRFNSLNWFYNLISEHTGSLSFDPFGLTKFFFAYQLVEVNNEFETHTTTCVTCSAKDENQVKEKSRITLSHQISITFNLMTRDENLLNLLKVKQNDIVVSCCRIRNDESVGVKCWEEFFNVCLQPACHPSNVR